MPQTPAPSAIEITATMATMLPWLSTHQTGKAISSWNSGAVYEDAPVAVGELARDRHHQGADRGREGQAQGTDRTLKADHADDVADRQGLVDRGAAVLAQAQPDAQQDASLGVRQ
jgi:hypothetical protein